MVCNSSLQSSYEDDLPYNSDTIETTPRQRIAYQSSFNYRGKNLAISENFIPFHARPLLLVFLASTLFIPGADAAVEDGLSVPSSDQNCSPTFDFGSLIDYITPGVVILYLVFVLVLRTRVQDCYQRALRASLGVMFLIGLLNFVLVLNCRDFPSRVRAMYV
jgi:hypothetical protein